MEFVGFPKRLRYRYSFFRDTLLSVFDNIIAWRSRGDSQVHVKTRWRESHIRVVRDYVSKLHLNSTSRILSYAGIWLGDPLPCSPIKRAKTAVVFTESLLQEFFTVRSRRSMAPFINFLLQLLYCKTTESIDQINDRVHSLEKELRFLLTVLGDTSLLCEEREQAQNLSAEFEAVANEAGSFFHCLIFSMEPAVFETVDKRLGVLLEHINPLKVKIIKLADRQPLIAETRITPKRAVVDSLFIVYSLIYDLEDLLNQDNSLIVNVKDQIEVLHQELNLSLSFFKDISVLKHSEINELREPVMRIIDVAYEAEYFVNSLLVGDASHCYISIRLRDVIQKIKFIGRRLQEIKKDYDVGVIKLAKHLMSAQYSSLHDRRVFVDDTLVGFEDKATDILDQLVGGTKKLQIISIFGMPGLGKTTLARELHNHPSVDYRFDKRLWCVVSQTYHLKSLLVDILISSTSELNKASILNMEEDSLLECIYKSLKGRRYLVVIDDIWSSNVWDDLQRCFPDDGNGSRILFTTRHKDVAPLNTINYALPSLSNDQCWELLEKKVFQNEPCQPHLLQIGKKIAANCNGLPLAVVMVAGILSSMGKEESTWRKVEGNLASHIFHGEDNYMMQILELSYEHLPGYLKPCFLYFGTFPEDKEISVRKLKWLWIAEGFTRKEEKKSSEGVAEEYLKELIDKSLVMVAKRRSDGRVKACVMHDLLRELSLRRADEENFLKLVNNCSVYERGHRVLSVHHAPTPFSQHVRSFHGNLLKHRSLMFRNDMEIRNVLNMKLRVLNIHPPVHHAHIISGIEFLVHLRYLVIDDLSPSIGNLVNLEYLLVESRDYTVRIPCAILKIVKLRYFQIRPQAVFDSDCNSCSQISNLEYLSNVGILNLEHEEMLKCLPHLKKVRCYCDPFSVGNGAYRYPDFRILMQLESLNMTTFNGSGKMGEISFPSNIKKLTLSGLCLPWENMSIIGEMPNLQILKLARDAFVGKTWDTRDGGLQELRFLKLEAVKLSRWRMASSEQLPKLQRLVLQDCYHLQEIPCDIGEVVTIQMIEVQGRCPGSLVESARQIEQEQGDVGNEELRVIIRDIRETRPTHARTCSF